MMEKIKNIYAQSQKAIADSVLFITLCEVSEALRLNFVGLILVVSIVFYLADSQLKKLRNFDNPLHYWMVAAVLIVFLTLLSVYFSEMGWKPKGVKYYD